MIASMLRFTVERPLVARMLTLMVLLLGAMTLYSIKLQEYPNVAFESADIETVYPGASAQDIELNITNPIEQELLGIDGINYFSSLSTPGHSSISLEFLPGTDATKVLDDIQQAVDRTQGLPLDLENPPTVTQRDTASFTVLSFGVSQRNNSDKSSEESTDASDGNELRLQDYAYQLERTLRNVAGVGDVSLSGFRQREFWIELNADQLARYLLTANQVSDAVRDRNLSQSAGIVTEQQTEYKLVATAQLTSASALAQMVVKVMPAGAVVRLGDVATVTDTFEKAVELGVINGQQGVLFHVSNSSQADIVATVERVKQLLAEQQQQYPQLQFDYAMDLAKDMSDRFAIVASNGAIGLLLVLVLLTWALQRKLALWVALSIPFCVFGAVALLPMFGLTLDSITLASLLLVIGIIVDDSVIVAESIYRQRQLGLSSAQAAITGTQRVLLPIIASLSTTALVFIPMLFIPGTMGKVVMVIPITVIAALLLSLLECSVTLPAHLANSDLAEPEADDGFQRFSGYYRRALQWCLRHRRWVLLTVPVWLLAIASVVRTLPVDIFPTEAAKYITIDTEIAPGTPLLQQRQQHQALESAILALPESERVSYWLSYSSPSASGTLELTNADTRQRTAEAIIDDLQQQLAISAPELFVKFSADAGGPPPGEPVEIRVLGGEHQQRLQTVAMLMAWMEQQGLSAITHSESLQEPQYRLLPDYQWLARYQLTMADLLAGLKMTFDGQLISHSWLGEQQVDLRLLFDDQQQLAPLATTKIYSATGEAVPLGRLAEIETSTAPTTIKHYNGVAEITVTAQLSGSELTSVALADKLLNDLAGRVPAGVSLDVGGEAESTNETMSGFVMAFPMALLAIFLVLALTFNSVWQPLLVMAVIPGAVLAALLALWLHGQALSLFALIGTLGMVGVVVNNALMLTVRINELCAEGRALEQALLDAACERVRPILLTTLTTVAGLVPLVYGLGGTDAFMGPMALTLGYGLLLSLPMVLLLLPLLYQSGVAVSAKMSK